MNTAQTYLSLAPFFVSLIQALEQAVPQKGKGSVKLKAFNDITLAAISAGGPLAAQGIETHDPVTVTALTTQFATSVVGAINAAKDPTVQ